MYSKKAVQEILEAAIDRLVDNFASQPYIHRCEHSLHCELYTMLTVHRSLQGLYPLKDNLNYLTTLVHKEWPETIPRPDKKGRRGNFDLVILDPTEIPKHTTADFRTGKIAPAFVVEMGLDYDLNHLQRDHIKFTNSHCCANGYLVHLWQPHKSITAPHDALRTWLPTAKSKVAAVVWSPSGPLIKHLWESALAPRLCLAPHTQA